MAAPSQSHVESGIVGLRVLAASCSRAGRLIRCRVRVHEGQAFDLYLEPALARGVGADLVDQVSNLRPAKRPSSAEREPLLKPSGRII